MKELRAFFELTSLSLLPLLVLLLAAPARRAVPESSPAPTAAAPSIAAAPVTAAAPVPSAFPEETLPPAAEAAVPAAAPAADAAFDVPILFGGEIRCLSLRDYLVGVLAAEMPASFEPAALEAQAVAARTDTLWRMEIARPHGEAACCTDPGCCKAYRSPEERQELWGEDFDRWEAKLTAAVDATDGEILTWEDEPIFAAFHASSAGRTEASENVWVAALPYLRSVSSPETVGEVPGFLRSVTFTRAELADRIREGVPGAVLGDDPALWLKDPVYGESGRLLRVEVGGVPLSGAALRSLLGLRSAAVTWTVEADGSFRFDTAGYGHGVGMSQYGAQAMAKGGATAEEILLHYYTGVELGNVSDVFRG